ncbi:hypothetical protein OAN59_02345 [Alphaproteobacteria bacterium]|nr:hypothetical protein [Alphaproteobacteria bacterium]
MKYQSLLGTLTAAEILDMSSNKSNHRHIYNKVITKPLTQITVRESDKLFDKKIMSRMAR